MLTLDVKQQRIHLMLKQCPKTWLQQVRAVETHDIIDVDVLAVVGGFVPKQSQSADGCCSERDLLEKRTMVLCVSCSLGKQGNQFGEF